MTNDNTAIVEGLRNSIYFETSTHILTPRTITWAIKRIDLINRLISFAEIKDITQTDKRVNLKDIVKEPPKRDDYETEEEYNRAYNDYQMIRSALNLSAGEHLYIDILDYEYILRLINEMKEILALVSAKNGAKLHTLMTTNIQSVKKFETPFARLFGHSGEP
ncbi:MAG: hypothetical protein QXT65_04540 [Candidatus Nitrosocaldaceae archaeon]